MIRTFVMLWVALFFSVAALVALLFGGDWLEKQIGTGLFVLVVVVTFIVLAAVSTRLARRRR